MNFKASFDLQTQLTTVFCLAVIILSLAILGRKIFVYYKLGNSFWTLSLLFFLSIFLLVASICAYGFSVSRYEVDNDSLKILGPFYKKEFKKGEISSIEVLQNEQLKGAVRTLGSGGLFGYWGKFRSPLLGNFVLYGTQDKNHILITLKNGKKIVITPDNTGIISYLK